MNTYYLFLDESKATGNIKSFLLGGCIIQKEIYENQIIPSINSLKTELFGDINVNLHEIDIRNAKKEPYKIFKTKSNREKFWEGMNNIFSNNELFIVCSVIDSSKYRIIYDMEHANDEYFVALQIILENYVYFLEKNDSKGSIYIESRNSKEDRDLTDKYHKIVADGTLYLNKYAFQKRLTTINFGIKADNIVGLQIADFIPNPVNRHANELESKDYSLLEKIEEKYYDGGIGSKERFGYKKLF